MTTDLIKPKVHYPVLDGLRGVAALIVVAFHILEGPLFNRFTQVINHGYLAVDFFFLLSGFVIGFAYDDRWGKMSVGQFFKRRLIRLQPMLILGMVIGAVCFYFQDSPLFPGIHDVAVWKVLMLMVIGFTLLPVPPSMDIRGWQEMHPLNGPGWSLFFEYIANILYGLFVRKFSNKALAVLVFIAGCALVHMAVWGPSGDVIGGWSLTGPQIRIGLTRVMFPFFAGLLLSRTARLTQIRHSFLLCSLMIGVALFIPRIGGETHLWMNGLYDSFIIILFFPLVVYLGASAAPMGKGVAKACKFFGDISYPLYITHYPIMYIFMGWISRDTLTIEQNWPIALLVFFGCIAISYGCLKLFDEPVRKWLSKRFA